MLQTLMIADDSMPLHALVRVQLQADCLEFHSVYDGAAAVSTAASLRPDLILLDVDMPRMDGFEACRRIKLDPQVSSIPLIFLSADSISANKIRGLELGAVDYIVKPFKPHELTALVRSSLRPTPISVDTRMVDLRTGLWNKVYFEKHLKAQFSLSQRISQPQACTVIEIDQLGMLNVKCGTTVANQVVRRVASLLFSEAGVESVVCCLPNRRFAILSSGSNRFDAARIAEQMRRAVERKFILDSGVEVNVTCSLGLCDTLIASAETLLDRANIAANRAVNRGGNCVSIARALTRSVLVA